MAALTTEHESPISIGRTGPDQPALLQGELAPFLAPRGYPVEVRWSRPDAAMHVHSLHPGHHDGWRVTFPYELRQLEHLGARYLVEALEETPRGYYRASGRIWRVIDGLPVEDVTPPPRRRKHGP